MNQNYSREIEDDYADVALGSRRIDPARRQASRPTADTVRRQQVNRQDEEPRRRNPRQQPQQRRDGRQQKEKSGGMSLWGFFVDPRTHLAFGIFLCVLAVVMIGTAISFMVNGGADQSVILGRTMAEAVQAGDEIQNAGGVFGAKLANFLLVDTLGVGSFIISIYVFLVGLALMKVRRCKFWSLTFKSLFSAVAVSIIVGLFTYNRESFFHVGGNHGYYVNQVLQAYSGALGAFAVTVVLAGILLAIFYNPVSGFIKASATALPKVLSRGRKAAPAPAPAATPATAPITLLDEDETDVNPTAEAEEDIPAKVAAAPSLDEFDSEGPQIPLTVVGREPSVKVSVPAEPADEVESQDPKESAAAEVAPEIKNEPEMVIVNAGEASETQHEPAPAPIRDGDHIGLDQPYDHCAELSGYVFPSTELLVDRPKSVVINEDEQAANKNMIVNALRSYNIEIARIEATIGPTVTLYEIVPAEGVRIAKIKSLEDDIAMSLAALGIRIIAPMPGKGTIGIEVPNRKPQTVSIRAVLESEAFNNAKEKLALPMALGATITNEIFVADLAKMPHLLVAGATGQGKSVGLNCIISSLLYSKHPSELKFVLVDPKMVEFSLYRPLEHHYLAKLPEEDSAIITDPMKVVATLNSLCTEMDNRYELLSQAGAKSLEEYNRKYSQRRLNPEQGHRYMPYIVVVVDEFADLVMTAGKDVSVPIARIAQKARAVGMHMILATQRPSTDVITGMIKANFPGRIAFRVMQMVDSKTILDRPGANRLIGRGDMLFSHNGSEVRVQCAFIDTEEIEAIVEHIDRQTGFPTAYLLPEAPVAEDGGGATVEIGRNDQKFFECARFVGTQNVASASMLQRKFQIGFNKAGRIMDQLYSLGVVGPPDGAKPRQVLMTSDEIERILSSL